MKRALLAAAGALLVSALTAGCGAAPAVPPTTTTTEPKLLLDQENNPAQYDGTSGAVLASCGVSVPVMQTFTAGRTGLLERVSMPLLTYVNTPPPLIVTVHPLVAADTPDLTVELGRGTYGGPGLGEFIFPPAANPVEYIDLALAAAAPVVAGSQYALLMRLDPAECEPGVDANWVTPNRYSTTDSYAGGGLYQEGDFGAFNPWLLVGAAQLDLIFQTWVR